MVPDLLVKRFKRMEEADSLVVRAAWQSRQVQMRYNWGVKMLSRFGIPTDGPRAGRKGYWETRLHTSVDGHELKESVRTRANTRWIANATSGIPGRDYIQYVRVHSNSLPTRVRTSRGQRRADSSPDVNCRAGCLEQETAAHVIQRCHRTHGGRVLRHNAVCNVIATDLARRGWQAEQEPHVQTGEGLRKPDIVAIKEKASQEEEGMVACPFAELDVPYLRRQTMS